MPAHDRGVTLDTVLWLDVAGILVPTDRRDHEQFGAHTLTLSEPYMLRLMEFGGGAVAHDLAARVFAAQEARFTQEGILTAVSEDHIDGPPYFVYNAVVANGQPWHAITESGADATAFRSLSTKAAIAWASIYDTPYAATLNEAVADLFDPEAGWYAGRFEASGLINEAMTANTNGIVLESLHHRRFGPLLHPITEVLPAAGQAAPADE